MNISPTTVIRPAIHAGPITVVVVGCFRGGTSYIGDLLHTELSVSMGDKFTPVMPTSDYVSYEDIEIAAAIDELGRVNRPRRDLTALKKLVETRDKQHPAIWGFKKPSSVLVLDDLLPLLRNPHLIVVLRDPLAVCQTGQARGEVQKGDLCWQNVRNHNNLVLDVIDKPRCPTLGVSFERARGIRKVTSQEIADFLGIEKGESPDARLSRISQPS
jgi:hypothetical protein